MTKLHLTNGQRVALEELERLAASSPFGVSAVVWIDAVRDRFDRPDNRRPFVIDVLERHGLAEVRRVRVPRNGRTAQHNAWRWFITPSGRRAVGQANEVAA